MTYNWFEMSSHAQMWTHFQQKSSVIKTRFPSVISEFPKRDTNAKEPGLTATKSELTLVKNLTDFNKIGPYQTKGQQLDWEDCKVDVETCKKGEKIHQLLGCNLGVQSYDRIILFLAQITRYFCTV